MTLTLHGMSRRQFRILVLLICAASTCLPQNRTATIKGMVVDPQGTVLRQHPVRVSNTATKKEYYSISDFGGNFYFYDLPTGTYVIQSVTHPSAAVKRDLNGNLAVSLVVPSAVLAGSTCRFQVDSTTLSAAEWHRLPPPYQDVYLYGADTIGSIADAAYLRVIYSDRPPDGKDFWHKPQLREIQSGPLRKGSFRQIRVTRDGPAIAIQDLPDLSLSVTGINNGAAKIQVCR